MNWKQVVCYTVGCKWRPADDGSRGIAGAFKCARCGADWPAVVWPKAPPMPECKPPRADRLDDILAEIKGLRADQQSQAACVVSASGPIPHIPQPSPEVRS